MFQIIHPLAGNDFMTHHTATSRTARRQAGLAFALGLCAVFGATAQADDDYPAGPGRYYDNGRYGDSGSGGRYVDRYSYGGRNDERPSDQTYDRSYDRYDSADDRRYREESRRDAVDQIRDEIAYARESLEADRRRTERLRAQARSEREAEDLRLDFEDRREAFERWRERMERERERIESGR